MTFTGKLKYKDLCVVKRPDRNLAVADCNQGDAICQVTQVRCTEWALVDMVGRLGKQKVAGV